MRCPFCDKGRIEIHYRPAVRKANLSTTVGGRTAKTASSSSPVEEPLNSCKECGAKRKDIQKKLKEGLTKPPSNKEILKRLKEAGLPTKVGGKGKR